MSASGPGVVKAVQHGASRLYGRFSDRTRIAGTRVLMYHSVGTPIDTDALGLYNIHPRRFEEHAHCVGEERERVLALGDWKQAGRESRIAVTFDDGYRGVLDSAAPVLTEHRIPFTVFVWTGAVRTRRPEFLTPEDLRRLQSMPGVVIGSHTVNHIRLTELPLTALRAELADSKAYLEDLVGVEVASLSYPHGAVDRRVRDAAEEAGYRVAATSRFGINEADADPLLLRRIDVWASDDVACVKAKLRGEWDWMGWMPR
jgi:peptidoglycan/xylan/chitin deacetylase (PgdA/CDA1 family)